MTSASQRLSLSVSTPGSQRCRANGMPRPLDPGWGRAGSESGGSGKGAEKNAQPAQAPPPAPSLPKLNGRPLTGEITISSRPISARWKPGAPLEEQPSRARRVPRPRRGSSRQPAGGPADAGTDGDPSAATGSGSGPAAPRGTAPGQAGPAPSGPPAGS